jgi:hypothetical protein
LGELPNLILLQHTYAMVVAAEGGQYRREVRELL